MFVNFWLWLQLLFYNSFKHVSITCGNGCRISNLHLSSCGTDNVITLGANVKLNDVTISIFGSHNRIVIKDNNNFDSLRIAIEDDGNKIEIGKHNFIGKGSLLAALEGTKIHIGDNCMIASPCEIRTSDSHSLLDADGNRVNYAKDIILGGHVWVGMGVLILKGAILPKNCVVAAKSVVGNMKNVKEGSLLAGIPARVIRENIKWNCKRIK